MKSKDKKYIQITIKNFIIFIGFVIIVLYCILFYNFYFVKSDAYTKETSVPLEETKISQAKEINLDEIIAKNHKDGIREEYTVEEMELEYITKYKNNPNLPKGRMQVIQEGRAGKQEITIKKVYEKENLIEEKQVSTKITKAYVDKIVEVGTGNYKKEIKAKVGDYLYVTSDRLPVMVEPQEDTQKIATLLRGNKLKLLEIQNQWYKISCSGTIGYVKSECTTVDSPEVEQEDSSSGEISKAQLLSNLSFGMALNKPSGLTLEQFKKILTDSKDTNHIFQDNAEYFYYIEKQYNINGVFVAAIGIHESAWGTSKIAKNKNNLFGYGAYDSNPYQGAYNFSDYSESIDLIARVLVKYYINPKGTSIYGNEKAVGTYYNGATLTGVNVKYATDKNWANGVYQHMKYLYNKL